MEEKGEKLKGLGVRPVVGLYDNLDVLERESGDADVVFSLVNGCGVLLLALNLGD